MVILGIVGAILLVVGFIWLMIVAFRTSPIWGILNIFFQPFAGLIYCIAIGEGWKQFLMMVGGGILFGVGYAGTIVDIFNALLK